MKRKKKIKRGMKVSSEQIQEREIDAEERRNLEGEPEGRKRRNVNRSMTRNSIAATVISFGGFAVINEWINRGSVERRCIDDIRESGVVSFTREIHESREEQHVCGIRWQVCVGNRTRYHVSSMKDNGKSVDLY